MLIFIKSFYSTYKAVSPGYPVVLIHRVDKLSCKICRITKKDHQNIAECIFRPIENNYFGFQVKILSESAELLLEVGKILVLVT